jgi:hypothetical protein
VRPIDGSMDVTVRPTAALHTRRRFSVQDDNACVCSRRRRSSYMPGRPSRQHAVGPGPAITCVWPNSVDLSNFYFTASFNSFST